MKTEINVQDSKKNSVNLKSTNTENQSSLFSTIILILTLIFTALSFWYFPILISLLFFIIFFLPLTLWLIIGKITNRWGISFLWASLIYIVILIVLGLWIYFDTKSLMSNFESQPKYLFYTTENNPLFAYKIINLNTADPLKSEFIELTKEEVNSLKSTLNNKDKFALIVDKEVFSVLPENLYLNIDASTLSVTKKDALNLLESSNPLEDLVSILYQNQKSVELSKDSVANSLIKTQLTNQFRKEFESTQSIIKSSVLFLLLAKSAQEKGPVYLIQELNNGKISLSPNYLAFWIIKNIPASLIKDYLPDFSKIETQ